MPTIREFTRLFRASLRPDQRAIRVRPIRFRGRRYLLIGTKKYGAAIATKRQYENGPNSYAHLFPNGHVVRYGYKIGTVKGISFEEPKPKYDE